MTITAALSVPVRGRGTTVAMLVLALAACGGSPAPVASQAGRPGVSPATAPLQPAPMARAMRADGRLRAEQGWIRATAPGATVAGGYVTLRNDGKAADRLRTVQSPAAARIEIHEMRMQGDTMQMRALDQGVAVAPGETVALAPGGVHLMLIEPARAFVAGESVEVTLTFDHAPPQTVAFAVQPLGSLGAAGTAAPPAHDGGAHAADVGGHPAH